MRSEEGSGDTRSNSRGRERKPQGCNGQSEDCRGRVPEFSQGSPVVAIALSSLDDTMAHGRRDEQPDGPHHQHSNRRDAPGSSLREVPVELKVQKPGSRRCGLQFSFNAHDQDNKNGNDAGAPIPSGTRGFDKARGTAPGRSLSPRNWVRPYGTQNNRPSIPMGGRTQSSVPPAERSRVPTDHSMSEATESSTA